MEKKGNSKRKETEKKRKRRNRNWAGRQEAAQFDAIQRRFRLFAVAINRLRKPNLSLRPKCPTGLS